MSNVKQVIVVRKDLNMRKGKIAAQASHAAMAFITKHSLIDSNTMMVPLIAFPNITRAELIEWINDKFTKVCVSVDSEAELVGIQAQAKLAGLHVEIIVDAGLTEFHGVPTKTCIAIGPHAAKRIDPITRHLKLL